MKIAPRRLAPSRFPAFPVAARRLAVCLAVAGLVFAPPALARTKHNRGAKPKPAAAAPPAPGDLRISVGEGGEPLPPGAPAEPYALAAWCFGAMSEYLDIYDMVKPDLRDIDKLFGSSVKNEAEPYAQDIAAARQELKVLSGAVEAAEKASAQVIAPQGAAAVKQGRGIWVVAEQGSKRELARAWLSWALPDRCDANAREVTTRSALLGQALKFNAPPPTDPPAAAPRP